MAMYGSASASPIRPSVSGSPRQREHLPAHHDDLRLARERERAVGEEELAEVGDAREAYGESDTRLSYLRERGIRGPTQRLRRASAGAPRSSILSRSGLNRSIRRHADRRDRRLILLARADADHPLDRQHEDLAVADVAGARAVDDRLTVGSTK